MTLTQRRNVYSDPNLFKSFIRGVKALKRSGVYDRLVTTHYQVMAQVHRTPMFLPWHRAFLLTLERELQQALGDPTFGLPYWDWTDDLGAKGQIGALWQQDWLGGTANPGSADQEVVNGPFVASQWSTINTNSNPRFGKKLLRTLGAAGQKLTYTTPTIVHRLFGSAAYDTFRTFLESGPHNNMHVWVGGQMSDVPNSVNDPVFWLHHANVDRIWAQWQHIYPNAAITAPNTPNFGPRAKMPPTLLQAGALEVKDVWAAVGQQYDYDRYYGIDQLKFRVWTGGSIGAGTDAAVSALLRLRRPGTTEVLGHFSDWLDRSHGDHTDPFERGQLDTFTYDRPSFSPEANVTSIAALQTPIMFSEVSLHLIDDTWTHLTSAWDMEELEVVALGATSASGVVNKTLDVNNEHATVSLQRAIFPPMAETRLWLPLSPGEAIEVVAG